MNIKTHMLVNDYKIGVMYIDGNEYISLTDLAKFADKDEPRFPILNWMRNKDVIMYLGLWESINNINFNRVEFDTVRNEARSNKFKISPKRWIQVTSAVGIISKSGKNGCTYAHSDIAFLFVLWYNMRAQKEGIN